jgi:hypothetical protein
MKLPLLTLAWLACATATAATAPIDAAGLPPDLRINEIQVLGTHNSYEMGLDPHVEALFEEKAAATFSNLIERMPPAARALFIEEHPHPIVPSEILKYSHPSLAAQLDLGVRSLEIDVNPDPKGGTYSDPVSYRMLRAQGIRDLLPFDATGLDKPGFKVLHVPDIDFRSHCPTLRLCLTQIRTWSDAHPGHVPLFIMIEAKNQDLPILPGATHTIPFTPALFDDLDRELAEGMGRDHIITPDDVRGAYPTLNQAVRAGQWPKLADARGKVLFMMLTANGPAGAAGYLQGHPSLMGRTAFLRAEPGEDHAAFLMYDNALVRSDMIKQYVREGYIIRTRSDIETHEAKVNDTTRAKAAFDSGAQIVSTDFELPGNEYGTSYLVRLPGDQVARCRPHAESACAAKP